MAYTTISKSTDYFNTKLYSGSGAIQMTLMQVDKLMLVGSGELEQHQELQQMVLRI